MTTIFVSHSSKNDEIADKISQWLVGNGFDDHFVDHLHIMPGDDWDAVLRTRASEADVFLLIVTPDWLASDECYAEYRSAFYANKPVVPLFFQIDPSTLSDDQNKRFATLCASVQGTTLAVVPPTDIEAELLKGALVKALDRVKSIRRWRIIKYLAIFVFFVVALLGALAAYYSDYVVKEYRNWRISSAFQPASQQQLDELAANAGIREQTPLMECVSNDFCPEMIAVPAATYRMGSGEEGEPHEQPPRNIAISAFAVSVFEITQAQWKTCSSYTQLQKADRCKELPTSELDKRKPVSSVSWSDAQSYVAFLNQQLFGTKDGPYRLLSEAEWEYAARGTTEAAAQGQIYHWGDDEDGACGYANMRNLKMPEPYWASWQGLNCPDNPEFVSDVGSFAANGFGLRDTAGNVTEWVEDCWHDSHHQRPLTNSAWTTSAPVNCKRVLKGGSWYGLTDNLRSAAREKLAPELYGFNIGFRVARDLNWEASP